MTWKLIEKAREEDFFLKKDLFRSVHANGSKFEDDRIPKIRVTFNKHDPTTKSGVRPLKSNHSEITLAGCKKSVPEVLDETLVTLNKIILAGGHDAEFVLKVYSVLTASGNADFFGFC